MWTAETIRERAARSGEGATRVFTVVQSQPSWITRAALTAALLVFSAIVLLLVVPAVLVATVVFFVLALFAGAWRGLRSAFGGDDSGRRNVKVVVRR